MLLATGSTNAVWVKVCGQKPDTIYAVSERVKASLEGSPGVTDLYVEPVTGGKYLDIQISREQLGRYGLSVNDINMIVETAIGGSPVTQTIEGRERFSVNVRLPQDYRNSIDRIKRIPIQTATMGTIPLSAVADIAFVNGPPMIS